MSDPEVDNRVERHLREYGDIAVQHIDPRAFELTARRPGFAPRLGALVAVMVAVAVASIIGVNFLGRNPPSIGAGVGPSSACREIPAEVALSCTEAQASVSWGSSRVDRTRIWLTTLGAVKSTMSPAQQVSEPSDATPVWVFVYDGRWTCCLVGDGDEITPASDHSRWVHVVDATTSDGSFIYIHDWSDKNVPEALPPPS